MKSGETLTVTSGEYLIPEAAKVLFAERGYEDTTTAAICRLAGTSQSQLIKHFTDKQGLLDAIFEYAGEQINPGSAAGHRKYRFSSGEAEDP